MRRRLKGPPVLLLGGDHVALSVARSLGPFGVRVFALAFPHQAIRHSRDATWIRLRGVPEDFRMNCLEFLRGPESAELAGSILLATQDEALAMLSEHRAELQKKFLLDRSNPSAQKLMLDKLATYRAAREAGVPTPRFWHLSSLAELREVGRELTFPLVVKPRHGHLFEQGFSDVRHIVAESLPDVYDALDTVTHAGLEAFLVERIPGADDLLCSYNTYLDEAGKAWFDFTKRIIRRYPRDMGKTTYQVTDHVPQIKDLSLRLLRHAGLMGLADVEFKLDPRDGEYKLNECNARFTDGNALALRSGINIAELVYCQVTGHPSPEFRRFRSGLRQWHPMRDFAAYRELSRLDELGFWQWAGSLMHWQTLPVWSWRDPAPALMPPILWPARKLEAGWRRLRHGPAPAYGTYRAS